MPIASASPSSPVGCVLGRAASLDIKAVGRKNVAWDRLWNNAVDFVSLSAVPAGLGASFVFDGSNASILITQSGWFSYGFSLAFNFDDATLRGWIGLIGADVIDQSWFPPLNGDSVFVGNTLFLPADSAFTASINTIAAATGASYNISPCNMTFARVG